MRKLPLRCSDCGAHARNPTHPNTARWYTCGKTILADGSVDTACGHQPGSYMHVYFHDEPEYEAVRGHVSDEQFAAALEDRDGVSRVLGKPQHLWFRCVPSKEADWCDVLYHRSKKGPGAFPVTVAYYQDGGDPC